MIRILLNYIKDSLSLNQKKVSQKQESIFIAYTKYTMMSNCVAQGSANYSMWLSSSLSSIFVQLRI